MARPREGVLQGIKRVIRYLRKYPRCILEVHPMTEFDHLEVWTDSDWAGDVASRKSCSGGSMQLGGTTLHHWSKVQSNIALSSGEAELNAAVKAISESIGIKEIMKETFDIDIKIRLNVDASACRGILLRRGSGKVKHLATKQLWVQAAVECHGIVVRKIGREFNSADLLTHPSAHDGVVQALKQMGFKLVPASAAVEP
jgi:hypothetical protein